MARYLTKEEKDFIREHYNDMTAENIATALKRTITDVQKCINKFEEENKKSLPKKRKDIGSHQDQLLLIWVSPGETKCESLSPNLISTARAH